MGGRAFAIRSVYSGGTPGAGGAPSISTVSPSTGYVAGGTQITLNGTNMTGVTNVTVGGVACSGVTVDSSTQVRATVPKSASTGARDVVATNGSGSGTKTNGFTYDITSRPVFSSLIHTSIFDDSGITYTNATAAGATTGSFPRMVPVHSPAYDGGSVDTSEVSILTPGHNGSTGYAFRMHWPQTSTPSNGAASWATAQASLDTNFSPPTNKVMYMDFHMRITYAGSNHGIWPKFFAMSHGGGSRLETGIWSDATSRVPDPYNTSLVYWNINDDGAYVTQQPIGPYSQTDVADNGWFRFTQAYYPPQTLNDNLAIYRVWVAPINTAPESTQKIIDASAAAIGVTPPGGQASYVTQSELNNLKVASTIEHLWWGNVSAHGSSDACDIDISGATWWRET